MAKFLGISIEFAEFVRDRCNDKAEWYRILFEAINHVEGCVREANDPSRPGFPSTELSQIISTTRAKLEDKGNL